MNENQIVQYEELGQIANQLAAQNTLPDYRSRKSFNTLKAQDNDLKRFEDYLLSKNIPANDLGINLENWHFVTWGLVQGFILQSLQSGYSVASVNRALSTIKKYSAMALKAGVLSAQEKAMIADIQGYSRKDATRLNEKRSVSRVGDKKAKNVLLSDEQAKTLKQCHSFNEQGFRDAILMHLLIDHGLRVSEVALLSVDNFNLNAGEMRFYRPKVDKEQTHRLTPDTLKVIKFWFDSGLAPKQGSLLRSSRKGGFLTDDGMTVRAINNRVKYLGQLIGIENLSPHDLRHYWATRAARNETPITALQEAGGWSSLEMPRRYIENSKIANEGVK